MDTVRGKGANAINTGKNKLAFFFFFFSLNQKHSSCWSLWDLDLEDTANISTSLMFGKMEENRGCRKSLWAPKVACMQ